MVKSKLQTLFVSLLIGVSCLSHAEHAPKFKLDTLDGKTLTTQSLKGKVVVLDFWATWCGPCRQVSKIMQTLENKYAKQGVQIVCVDVKEPSPSLAAVTAYKKTHGYTYAFSIDKGSLDQTLKVTTLPTVVILDKSGEIIYRHTGLTGLDKEVDGAISKALKG